MDDAWLDSFAPRTVGAAYRDFVRERSPVRRGPGGDQPPADLDRRAAASHPRGSARRIRDTHDILVVLTGTIASASAQACLVAFPYAQIAESLLGRDCCRSRCFRPRGKPPRKVP